jgi:hypothetical protein
MMIMSMGRVYVSKLGPARGLLFNPQVIYEYVESRWNDTDRGEPKNPERNLSQCHAVHHKSQMDRPRREPILNHALTRRYWIGVRTQNEDVVADT